MLNKIWLSIGVAGVFASAAHGAILIDDFDAYQAVTATSATPSQSSALSDSGVIGMERELNAMHTSGSNDVMLISDAGGSSILNYSTGAGTLGMGTVTWDGVDTLGVLDPTGLGGVDLTDGGQALGLVIQVHSDDSPASLDFTIYTDGGNYSFGSLPLPGLIFSDQLFFLPFTDFTPQAGSGADLTNVGAIVMKISTQYPATDLQMEFIQADVPEPGAFALLGMAGLVGFRRRR